MISKKAFLVPALLIAMAASAQLQNYGNLHVLAGGSMAVSGSFINSPTSSSVNYVNDSAVYLKGDFTNNQSSMPQGSGKTYFNGTTLQNINGTQPSNFYNAAISNTSNVELAKDVSIYNVYTPTAGSLIIKSNTFTLNNTGIIDNTVSNTGTFTGSITSNMIFNGTGDVLGVVKFASGGRLLNNLTLNRGSTGLVSLGTDVAVNNLVNLTAGALAINGQTLSLNGTIIGAGTLTGSSASKLVVGDNGSAQSVAVGTLNFTTGAQLLSNFAMNRNMSVRAAAAVLGTDVSTNSITLTKGILSIANQLFTLSTAANLTYSVADYKDSYIATCNAAGVTTTMPTSIDASNRNFPYFNGTKGFKIMNVNPASGDVYFPVGADYLSPNRMMIDMESTDTRNFTVVVGKGDIGNTPTRRVNRIWYVSTGDNAPVKANVKLYFTKRNSANYQYPSVTAGTQDEIENGFSFDFLSDKVTLLQKDSMTTSFINVTEPGTADEKQWRSIDGYGYGSEVYAQYTINTSHDNTAAGGRTTTQSGVKYFTKMTVVNGASGVVLPVTFLTIRAYQQASAVNIEWAVANQVNISSYVVERATDGRLFTAIGTLDARNTGASNYNYTLPDAQPVNGINYYRVKAIGLNGEITYTNVVNVTISANGKSGMVIYPNPVTTNKFMLQLTNMPAGKYQLVVISMSGQSVLNKTIEHMGGSATQTIYLSGSVATGIYNVQLFNKDTKLSTNIFVNHN